MILTTTRTKNTKPGQSRSTSAQRSSRASLLNSLQVVVLDLTAGRYSLNSMYCCTRMKHVRPKHKRTNNQRFFFLNEPRPRHTPLRFEAYRHIPLSKGYNRNRCGRDTFLTNHRWYGHAYITKKSPTTCHTTSNTTYI